MTPRKGQAETMEGAFSGRQDLQVQMMHGVAGSAIDEWRVGIVFSIMDENCPEVDEDEESNICKLLKRKEEREQMVWNRLSESNTRVEGMRGERSRHDPFVVRFVESLVD